MNDRELAPIEMDGMQSLALNVWFLQQHGAHVWYSIDAGGIVNSPTRVEVGDFVFTLPRAVMFLNSAAFCEGFSELLTNHVMFQSMAAPLPRCAKRVDPNSVGKMVTFRTSLTDRYEPCAICLEAYKPRNKIWHLHGKHCFHKKCLERWFRQHINTQCPLCRMEVGA